MFYQRISVNFPKFKKEKLTKHHKTEKINIQIIAEIKIVMEMIQYRM